MLESDLILHPIPHHPLGPAHIGLGIGEADLLAQIIVQVGTLGIKVFVKAVVPAVFNLKITDEVVALLSDPEYAFLEMLEALPGVHPVNEAQTAQPKKFWPVDLLWETELSHAGHQEPDVTIALFPRGTHDHFQNRDFQRVQTKNRSHDTP
jgi:hypothetical protein